MTTRVLIPDLVSGELQAEQVVEGPRGHHLARVVRVRVGDAVVAFDGLGHECDGAVAAIRGDAVTIAMGPSRIGVGADRADVTWVQGIPKGDRMETIVRQATELGVRAIWPVFTARSVIQSRGPLESTRTSRLQKVAEEAARQSGRADVPEVFDACPLGDALTALVGHAAVLRLVAWEEASLPLVEAVTAVRDLGPCICVAGPEGGLEAIEVEGAVGLGYVAVSLGPRILRAETVAPSLLSVLAVLRGDLAVR